MKAEAHVIRGVQRQDLLERIRKNIFEAEEKAMDQKTFWLQLIYSVLPVLQGVFPKQTDPFFLKEIYQPIKDFSRSEAEKKVMLTEILERLIGDFTREYRSELQKEEIFEPRKIFHASGAMEEIEVPGDL